MKGSIVIIIFILINIIAFAVFGVFITSSMEDSINEQEYLSRSTLDSIISIYDEKNIASANYLNALLYVPNLDSYMISTFSNYLNQAYNIQTDESLIEKPLTFQELQYVQARIEERINYFDNRARNYPALRTNQVYINARNDIRPIIKNEKEQIKLYNKYAFEYNKLTTRVPSSIIAGFTGKFPFLYFETGTDIISKVSHLFE